MRGSVIHFTNPERNVLSDWPRLLSKFVSREWTKLFGWFGTGAVLAGLFRLGWSDHSFRAFLKTNYIPTGMHFDNASSYVRFALAVVLAVALGTLLDIPRYIRRGFRSWWAGVTSGLALFVFGCTFVFLSRSASTPLALLTIAEYSIGFGVVSFLLFLKANMSAKRRVSEEELLVPSSKRQTAGLRLPESDDPIESWEEDALGRAALVDSICVKLLISKSPVIALFGPFGSGKTSTLNLLREHLTDKAIVVSFSTWLPGSQETLTAYLLSDIASQVQKQYVVPGLRKSARRMAAALGKTVPIVKTLAEAMPAATQKEDIDDLKNALSLLPKRVVVLLDELDRMERDELLTLLKIIRGISTLPNLSFVCAGDRLTIIKIVDKSEEYFEKFFPVKIVVSDPSPEALQNAGIERLLDAFRQRDWFVNGAAERDLRSRVEGIWRKCIAPFCRNLRAVGLLANDVGVAAAPLRNEVDAIDLTLIEMLHRFRPSLYDLISRNAVVLTGGPLISRGGEYLSDKEKDSAEKQLISELKGIAPTADEMDDIREVLDRMFPEFARIDGRTWTRRAPTTIERESKDKRISAPDIFAAYFRYELPEAIFSSVELSKLLRRLEATHREDAREREVIRIFESLPKGSLKRDDLLRKLADAVTQDMSASVGKSVVHAIARNADKFLYDMMAPFAEAGHALRIIIRVAAKLPQAEREPLLSACILEATDDTLAFRVLRYLTGKHEDFDLGVSFADLYPSFIKRMRTRYGREVDANLVDLSTADPIAFDTWGLQNPGNGVSVDPEDRAIQHNFWARHIGNSRQRLAQDFRTFILPHSWIYSQDATISVENKIPVAKLKELYEQLPDDGIETDEDRRALRNLQRLLNGEFKSGIGPDGLHDNGWA